MITTHDSHDTPDRNQVNLGVEIHGSTITVRGGDFTVDGQERTLEGDWTFDMADRPETTSLVGYLAVDRGDGGVKVVVDERLPDEPPARFRNLPEYQFLTRLFIATVPGNATLPGDAVIRHFRVIPRPDKPEV